MEAYYYQHMSKPHQAAYHAMKVGFITLSSSFPVPKLENRDLSDIFFKLRLDCPEIFYVTGFSYRFYPQADHVELIPEYLFEKSKIKEHQKALASRISKLVRPAQSLSILEKEKYIHNFICQNVRYDKLKKPYSHEIIGPLGQGVGVCEGIAKSVKILCDQLGIWCIVAISEANPTFGIKYRHAWNVVKIDGQYFHLDATFDNSLGQDAVIRYDYFNLDDNKLFRDHQPVIYPIPSCSQSDKFYYRENKLSFTKIEDICKRAQMAIRKDLPFVFHWRGGHFTKDILHEVVKSLEETAQKKGKHAVISFNSPQAVLYARFPSELPTESLREEEANEGELYSEENNI